jgi:hypothetical protein
VNLAIGLALLTHELVAVLAILEWDQERMRGALSKTVLQWRFLLKGAEREGVETSFFLFLLM